MASVWKSIPKIDAHTHVILHDRENTDLRFNPPDAMLAVMDEHRVRRAVVHPISYPTYFPLDGEERADWLRANNERQARIAAEGEGRFAAFADCAIHGPHSAPGRGSAELKRAIKDLRLAGLKIHPTNLKTSADDPRFSPWIHGAAALGVPIVFHSNPTAQDPVFYGSAPSRIYQAVYGHDVTFVIAHMGGLANHELFGGSGYVDLSGALPTLGRIWGVERTREILRVIGIERLLFATDYPIFPYEAYYGVLDAMELEEHEIAMIAWDNAERMLQGLPPLAHEG